MSNIMNLKSLKNKVSRNGFDLSEKNAFTAKVGELLPVMVQEVMPGDKFKINVDWFTRTQPLNTAAFTRIREYYDFFFVPFDQLWRNFPTFYTNMQNNPTKADSIMTSVSVGDQCPYFTTESLSKYINKLGSKTYLNNLGYNRAPLTLKLLEYLGYGDLSIYNSSSTTFTSKPMFNLKMTPFSLLAYQKIYQDFYRDQQWEEASPWTYNLDYISTNVDMSSLIDSLTPITTSTNLFDLRYSNWHKDYFMGLLPNSQYGAEATLGVTKLIDSGFTATNFLAYSGAEGSTAQFKKQSGSASSLKDSLGNVASFSLSKADYQRLIDGAVNEVSIIALRQAEFLQKWKEIAQSGGQDYKHQIEKHYGVNVSEALSDHVIYLGGTADNLDINEVVNSNITESNEATIAGKGAGVGRGYIDFDSDTYGNRPGIIMCIYHAVPLLDYSIDGVLKLNTKVSQGDYAIPEFDRIGMTQTSVYELANNNEVWDDITNGGLDKEPLLDLGYAPRYVEYKTNYDKVHGEFRKTLGSWVAPISKEYIIKYFTALRSISNGTSLLTFNFLKVNPNVLDPIFAVDADENTSTDNLLVNSAFDIKVVRNLDRDGLPY